MIVPRDRATPNQCARCEREFAAEPGILRRVRHAVAVYARAHGASDVTVDALTLAVSEAASNAIMHAFVDLAPGCVSIIAEATEGALLVRVTDDGRGMTPRTDSPGLGLGLNVMASISSSCDVGPGPAGVGTDVRMQFAAPEITGVPTSSRAHDDV